MPYIINSQNILVYPYDSFSQFNPPITERAISGFHLK